MNKKFTVVVAIVAMVLLLCTLSACNNENELDRSAVTADFATLGIERVNENYKLNMTDDEIKSLDDPFKYIGVKHILIFVGEVLEDTSIRVQKLSKLNTALWVDADALFEDDEKMTNDKMANQGFNVFSNAEWTSEDIADFLYTALEHALTNGKTTMVNIKTDYEKLKDIYKVTDFDNPAAHQEFLDTVSEQIEDIEETIQSFDEINAEQTNAKKILKDAKKPLVKFFDAFAKTMLTFGSEFSGGSGIERVWDNTEGDWKFNITAKPEELSAYVGSIKTGFEKVVDAFSAHDAKQVSNSILTVVSLINQIKYPIPAISKVSSVFNMSAIVLNLYQPMGDILVDGLSVVDTAFAKNFIDIEKEDSTLVKENYAILYAKFLKSALKDKTATALKAELDAYKNSLGTDTQMRKKNMMGLVYLFGHIDPEGESVSEEDASKVMGTLLLDWNRNEFAQNYYAYLLTNDKAEKQSLESDLNDWLTQIKAAIGGLTGKDFTPTKTAYTQAWFDEIIAKCDSTLDGLVESSISLLIKLYKDKIDDIFTNKMADINKLAAMPMQTETSDRYAELLELEGKTGYGEKFREFIEELF